MTANGTTREPWPQPDAWLQRAACRRLRIESALADGHLEVGGDAHLDRLDYLEARRSASPAERSMLAELEWDGRRPTDRVARLGVSRSTEYRRRKRSGGYVRHYRRSA